MWSETVIRSSIRAALGLALFTSPAAGQSFTGCGATYGTCASVTLAAERLANGTWAVTVTLENISGVRSGIARSFGLTWNGGAVDPVLLPGESFDGAGGTLGYDFTPTSGFGAAGFDGYQERSDRLGHVVFSQITGAESAACASDPACTALRIPTRVGLGGDTTAVGYRPGPLTFRFTLDQFDPTTLTVAVGIDYIDGQNRGEYFALQPGAPVTVTPEPVTLVLLGSGLAGMGLARRRRAA